MNRPFFSIIIPTYNSSKTIVRTLKSVISQTYTNYEIIVIDGLSKDDTVRIIEELFYEKVKIYSERDRGIYDAMNKGIERTSGHWIYFLGSDDYLMDNGILQEVYKRVVNLKQIDLVYGDVESNIEGMEFKGEYDLERLNQQNICHQAMFFRKEVFRSFGTYELKYKILSDWHFNIRYFEKNSSRTQYINFLIAFFSYGGISSSVNEPEFHQWRVKYYKRFFLKKNSPNYLVYLVKLAYENFRKKLQ